MLNYIWTFMIIVGVVYGVITGNIDKVGNGAAVSYTHLDVYKRQELVLTK